MRRFLADLVRSLAALVTLAALVLGVPWALARFVGWPLPTAVPSLRQLRDALSGNSISDAVILKTLAVLCWVAWAQLVACALAELGAWWRGRTAPTLPTAGLLQPVVRRLVLSALLVLGTVRSPSARPLPLSVEPAMLIAAHPDPPAAEPSGSPAAPTISDRTGSVVKTCVVKPRDSLWRLAELHLGDGMRWRELADLNLGVPQPDGRAMTDPDLIHPGWVVRFPADAVGLDMPVGRQDGEAQPSLPAVGELPPPATAVPPPAAFNQPTTPASSTFGSPGAARVEVPRAVEPTEREPANGREALPIPTPLRVAGGTLLAAGVIRSLQQLRRVQQRRRRPGRTVPLPTGQLVEAETVLRRAASTAPAIRLDTAMRALAGCLAQRKRGVLPRIEAVSVGTDGTEILFAGPVRAPHGPFEVIGGGLSWTLPAKHSSKAVASLADPMASPLPALVAVGHVDGKEILLDGESPARTCVTGDAEEVDGLLVAMALGLATSTWADDLRLVLVGEPPPGLGGLERVRVVSSIEAVIDDLELEVQAVTKELVARGSASTLEARCSSGGDTWTPVVVVLRNAGEDGLERLLELAGHGHGLSVVGADLPEALVDRELVLSEGKLLVRPPGLELTPLGAVGDATREAAELLELAHSDEEGQEALGPAMEVGQEEHSDVTPVLLPGGELSVRARGGAVFVGVLGAVQVEGGARPIDRRKSKELFVYLALHPQGVDEGRIKAALWPDTVPTTATFNQTVSKARASLGSTSTNDPFLPHVRNGLYRSEHVVTDFERLSDALRRANNERGKHSMEALAAALGLVRGLPFEGSKEGYEWAYAEGLVARISSIVADAAHLVAQWAIEEGDTGQALWAAAQGLLASPGDEVLFRDRMRAHDRAGNPAGVESVMSELCHVVEGLEPYDSLHPETQALYQELCRGRKRRAG
ncbi:MAG: LysM peptidoglycan-binding domain-containing protein [Actinomycetota bacterium]|nr:LysM peptidoglycan-binding domain-containing protein [Actinomycetota bacterium]